MTFLLHYRGIIFIEERGKFNNLYWYKLGFWEIVRCYAIFATSAYIAL